MEALIFHRNYYNSALQTNVTSSVIGLCSSSFISSPKPLICVVLVLVPSCLLLLVQIQSISISKLFVCLFRIEVPSCLYVLIQFQLYAVCSPISSLVLVPSYLLARSCSSSGSMLLVYFQFLFLVPSLEKTAQPDGILYFQSYVICLK